TKRIGYVRVVQFAGRPEGDNRITGISAVRWSGYPFGGPGIAAVGRIGVARAAAEVCVVECFDYIGPAYGNAGLAVGMTIYIAGRVVHHDVLERDRLGILARLDADLTRRLGRRRNQTIHQQGRATASG